MRIFTKTDFWLGIVVAAGGIWAYIQSLGFDDASRNYPMYLSVVTGFLGAGIAAQAIRDGRDDPSGSIQWLFHRIKGSMLIIALFVMWTVLLSTETGYLLSSVLMLIPVLWLLGYRKIGRLALTTFGIIGAVFTLFYIIFEVPLPLNSHVQALFDLLN